MQQIIRKGIKDILVEEVPDPMAGPHHVLIRPVFSLISSGTETASIHQEGVLKEVADNPSHIRKVLDVMQTNGPIPTIREVNAKFSEYAALYSESIIGGSFIKGNIEDTLLLDQIFRQERIDAVIHLAAYIDVGESVKDPALYYKNNVCNTLSLLKSMLFHNIKTFIFPSSAAVYGTPNENPITENHPCSPINPYGESKLMVEKILKDFDRAYGLKYCALRYFNAAGGILKG